MSALYPTLEREGVKLVAVPGERMHEIPPFVWELLDTAINWQTTLELVKQQVRDGSATLWMALDGQTCMAVAVTEVLQYPAARMFSVAYCAGKQVRRWIHLFQVFRDLAKRTGCDGIELQGKNRAWGRLLGLEPERIVFTDHFSRGIN